MSNTENRGSTPPANSTRIGNGKGNTPPNIANNKPASPQGGTRGKVNTPPPQAPKPNNN